VKLTSSLQHDLGAESLDYLDIAFRLEREYKVHFPREDLLARAAEFFGGADNLVQAGVVTDVGLKMLRTAMPEVDPAMLKTGLRAEQVPGLFTVGTFARVLDRLLAAKETMSRVCPKCGATMQDSNLLPEMSCAACQTTVPFPTGDEVMFQELVRLSKEG
jgi:acyl carrier protein